VAPLIEGETGNDLPDNAPPSAVFPSMPSSTSGLPTPPASPLPPLNEREKTPSGREEETPPVVNPSQQETDLTSDLGYSIYGRRRRPSRRLLESLGKVYSAGTLNTGPARQVDPATFHEAVSGPDQLGWWAAIQKEYTSLLEHGNMGKDSARGRPSQRSCDWLQMSLQDQSQRDSQSATSHQRLPAETRHRLSRNVCCCVQDGLRPLHCRQYRVVRMETPKIRCCHGISSWRRRFLYLYGVARRLRRARVRMPAAPLTVRTEAGSADLVPMRPPRPGFPWLHHGPIGQLCILQTELRRLRLCR
jgi:hypothetical protein